MLEQGCIYVCMYTVKYTVTFLMEMSKSGLYLSDSIVSITEEATISGKEYVNVPVIFMGLLIYL